MVVYDEKSDDASLQYSTSATCTNLWKQPPPKVTGFFIGVFISKFESKQYNRSCVQDALLNASQLLGVPMSKKKLYEDFPPDEFHDIQLRKAFSLPIVQSELQFCVMNVERLKGGAEYNILQFRYCGVYFCLFFCKRHGIWWF